MAHQEGIIPKYPWEGLKPPEVFYPEIHPLHPDAVKALIVTASPRYRALVRQAASTGLRQGELFGLEDGDPSEAVTVKQQLIGPDKGVPYLGEPKTRQSYRTVPQGRSVVDEIARHREKYPAESCAHRGSDESPEARVALGLDAVHQRDRRSDPAG